MGAYPVSYRQFCIRLCKNPSAVLERIESLGANVITSGDKLQELVTHIRCKRKFEFQKKNLRLPFKKYSLELN